MDRSVWWCIWTRGGLRLGRRRRDSPCCPLGEGERFASVRPLPVVLFRASPRCSNHSPLTPLRLVLTAPHAGQSSQKSSTPTPPPSTTAPPEPTAPGPYTCVATTTPSPSPLSPPLRPATRTTGRATTQAKGTGTRFRRLFSGFMLRCLRTIGGFSSFRQGRIRWARGSG